MIEPTYRRDQLWAPRRPRVAVTILVGGIIGMVLTVPLGGREFVGDTFVGNSPHREAKHLVARIAGGFPAWRAHHDACPDRLGELAPDAKLDPWGHALHYTCDPRLVPGHHFAVISAGEDGVFGTSDDIAAHD